jgi:RNA polymerase sigma-70 factor, ECF subfamily
MAVLCDRGARKEVRSFRAWLFQVARNLCLNRVRKSKRAGRAFEAAAHVEAMGSAPVPAEQALLCHQQAEMLQKAVARLPEALGDIYQLRASGMSYDEVAEALRIPVGTVKSRMHEVVKRLREEVSG